MGIKKVVKAVEGLLEEKTPEAILTVFSMFLDQVQIASQFIQNEDDIFTHQLLTMVCGDKIIVSEPRELEWPLQMMPMPEVLKGKVN